ncbi:MAG: 16S rRNA (cytosine(1402)-N(4))-methyltransferase RsmH [Caldilineaceae bacterium]|nr:16S rRNA (cytosine(1402)-N(4))-methyltransferase RsmH [Caldilineaceae bacterium]
MNVTTDVAVDPPAANHIPIMLAEILAGLPLQAGSRVIDGTIGGGGHTAAFLAQSAPTGQILGIDADPAAIRRVALRFSAEIAEQRLRLVQGNFGDVATLAQQHGFTAVDAILLDLGVSSFQLDTPERGFSFRSDGPLDMRFDPHQGVSAADIVNSWPEKELADILYQYGEERQSRRIARFLVQQRPFQTTAQLAEAIERAHGGRRGNRIHPATRAFQALRIAVNEELQQLEKVLPQCLELLAHGGRLAVLTFHSLEDRIVKQWMQKEASTYVHDEMIPQGGYERRPTLAILTRKPITAADAELTHNPRSRSAKLRIAEKI